MEASHALGIRHGPTLRLVIIPQALRVIIPPLISQYLNLTKEFFAGHPDRVLGSVQCVWWYFSLNQTGQAHRDYLHVDVGISLFQPADLSLYELVQPAHCADGAPRALMSEQ